MTFYTVEEVRADWAQRGWPPRSAVIRAADLPGLLWPPTLAELKAEWAALKKGG